MTLCLGLCEVKKKFGQSLDQATSKKAKPLVSEILREI